MTDTYRTNATPDAKPLTWWDKLLGRKPPVVRVPPEPVVYYNPVQDAIDSLNKLAESRFEFLTSPRVGKDFHLPLKSTSESLQVSYSKVAGVYLSQTVSGKGADWFQDSHKWYTPEVVEEIIDLLPALEEGLRKNQNAYFQEKKKRNQEAQEAREAEKLKWKNLAAKMSGLMEKKE